MFKSTATYRSRRAIIASFLMVIMLMLAACAPAATATLAPTDVPTSVPPVPTDTMAPVPTNTPAAMGVQVNLATKDVVGSYLVDSKGFSLYFYTKDTPGVSACTSAGCLKAWPILEATGDPVGGQGVTGKLGVITRTDGKKQVTMNDLPLYYYTPDKAAGDITGQGVGGVWYLADATGAMIKVGAATPAPTNTPAAASSGVQVNLGTKDGVGSFLVDGKGFSLYLFTKDTAGVSACTSAGCLSAWPILEATADPVAGTGVTGKLGVITRTDGKKQVTINDMPLYYYTPDKAAGDINGQAVGSVWYLADPAGALIKTSPTTPVSTNTPASASGVQVNTSTKTGIGSYVVDGKGISLYFFTKDTAGVSACTSAGCLSAWPILEATGDPIAGQGVTGKLGVITRTDGKKQVTLNDMPLYYYAMDKAAGDTTGQGVGSVWYLVDPSGAMIKASSGGGYNYGG